MSEGSDIVKRLCLPFPDQTAAVRALMRDASHIIERYRHFAEDSLKENGFKVSQIPAAIEAIESGDDE